MKLMIASDIHGSSVYCNAMLARFEAERADRLLLLGDLLYHGPRNALPEGYAPQEVAALLNGKRERLLCVRGNCDAEIDQMVLEFPILAEYALIHLDDFALYATHGHHANKDAPPPLAPYDVLACGHTHVPGHAPLLQGLFVNPGSVSIPKEDSAHGYLVYENRLFIWKRLSDGAELDRCDAPRARG